MQSSNSRTKLQLHADRRAGESLRQLGAEFRRLREDAGLSLTAVAGAAGIHRTHLQLIEGGERDASAQVLARVAAALGAEVSTRLFPTSGPRLRDRFQAPILEAFLRLLASHWIQAVEVLVHRPVRGIVDAVILDRVARRIVAIEAQSEVRRLEHQIRWARSKADALPSSTLWDPADPPAISRILLLRSTVATRELARTFAATLAAAYPADPTDLLRALADPAARWPGSGIIWVSLHGSEATILPGLPRGVQAIPAAATSQSSAGQ
jgi:transcriptional regulator with XRE-family HTH domain